MEISSSAIKSKIVNDINKLGPFGSYNFLPNCTAVAAADGGSIRTPDSGRRPFKHTRTLSELICVRRIFDDVDNGQIQPLVNRLSARLHAGWKLVVFHRIWVRCSVEPAEAAAERPEAGVWVTARVQVCATTLMTALRPPAVRAPHLIGSKHIDAHFYLREIEGTG